MDSARIMKKLQIQHPPGVDNLFMKLAIGRNPSCLPEDEENDLLDNFVSTGEWSLTFVKLYNPSSSTLSNLGTRLF
jgi:hypothetical protein